MTGPRKATPVKRSDAEDAVVLALMIGAVVGCILTLLMVGVAMAVLT